MLKMIRLYLKKIVLIYIIKYSILITLIIKNLQ